MDSYEKKVMVVVGAFFTGLLVTLFFVAEVSFKQVPEFKPLGISASVETVFAASSQANANL